MRAKSFVKEDVGGMEECNVHPRIIVLKSSRSTRARFMKEKPFSPSVFVMLDAVWRPSCHEVP
jgi:hypothetical protein